MYLHIEVLCYPLLALARKVISQRMILDLSSVNKTSSVCRSAPFPFRSKQGLDDPSTDEHITWHLGQNKSIHPTNRLLWHFISSHKTDIPTRKYGQFVAVLLYCQAVDFCPPNYCNISSLCNKSLIYLENCYILYYSYVWFLWDDGFAKVEYEHKIKHSSANILISPHFT